MTETNWKHIKTVFDGDRFELNGLNVWDYDWISTGKRIIVKDPVYGQKHKMIVYEIRTDKKTIKFAAGEFSNCVWGFYSEIQSKI